MAVTATPTNMYVQQGNGNVLITCDLITSSTVYKVYRSTTGVSYSLLASPTDPLYLDTTCTAGTLYYYYMTATTAPDTESAGTTPQSVIPVAVGKASLGSIRTLAQQKADMVNSSFVTVPEWNRYIQLSYTELYDLLVDVYEDYFVQTPYTVATSGSQLIDLPSDFYKLLGVDLGLASSTNAWVTLKKFEFIGRNRYIFPQLTSTYLGVFNLRYRLVGSQLMLIPTPSTGQYLRIWYIPRPAVLLKDTDYLDGVSGWEEYVAIDAAIKAGTKEETDISALMAEKAAMIKRIEDSAMNRDAGQPDCISDVRSAAERWGALNGPNGDGGAAGW